MLSCRLQLFLPICIRSVERRKRREEQQEVVLAALKIASLEVAVCLERTLPFSMTGKFQIPSVRDHILAFNWTLFSPRMCSPSFFGCCAAIKLYSKTMLSSSLRVARVSYRTVAVRAFADDAAQHRPVININGLAARYANATYIAASKQKQLDTIESELNSLAASAASSAKFAMFLENPLISRDIKFKAMQSLDKVSPVTRNLLTTLAGNARLSELPKIAKTFSQLMKAKRGEVDAKIISAEPLTKAMLKEVQAAMQSQVPKGKSVVIEAVTDPSIVAGLQVQIGDQFLDLSVKSRVEEIARMPLT
jgi:F-type H+-transporting ATPase subunit O